MEENLTQNKQRFLSLCGDIHRNGIQELRWKADKSLVGKRTATSSPPPPAVLATVPTLAGFWPTVSMCTTI